MKKVTLLLLFMSCVCFGQLKIDWQRTILKLISDNKIDSTSNIQRRYYEVNQKFGLQKRLIILNQLFV